MMVFISFEDKDVVEHNLGKNVQFELESKKSTLLKDASVHLHLDEEVLIGYDFGYLNGEICLIKKGLQVG